MIEQGSKKDKFERQSSLYEFPYHYIPHFDTHGIPSRQRSLQWGLEYLCYMQHIAELIDERNPSSLLDVGCGEGRLFSLLTSDIPRRVGIDLSERSIRFARAFNPDVEFTVSGVAEVNSGFEMVTAVEVLEHIPDSDVTDFVRGLMACVKPGGELIVSVPSSIRPVQAKHYRHYSADSLVDTIMDAGSNASLLQVEHVYEEPKWLEVWKRVTCNRLWGVEISFVRRFIWHVIWNSLRHSDPKEGRHVIGRFTKCSAKESRQ